MAARAVPGKSSCEAVHSVAALRKTSTMVATSSTKSSSRTSQLSITAVPHMLRKYRFGLFALSRALTRKSVWRN